MKRLPRVLIVEDEPAIAELIAVNLHHNGFSPIWSEDGDSAQRELDAILPDVILLDWMLPDQSGLALARKWRADSRTKPVPILMLTARGDEPDKIAGLDAGADDYLTKPFDLPELQARLRALIRRAGGAATPTLEHAGVVLEPASKRVTRDGQAVTLSAREYTLLHDLLSHKSHIRTRSQLEESLYAWGEETGSNTVEVYVHHLRKKLGADFIRTVRGLGYQLGDAG